MVNLLSMRRLRRFLTLFLLGSLGATLMGISHLTTATATDIATDGRSPLPSSLQTRSPFLKMEALNHVVKPVLRMGFTTRKSAPMLEMGLSPEELNAQADQWFQEGSTHYREAEYEEAIARWEQALTLYRQLQHWAGEALAAEGLGLAYEALGDCTRAIAFQRHRLALSEALGDRAGQGNALANTANCYQALGEYREAIAALETSRSIWQELSNVQQEGAVLANLGNVYAEMGHYDQAITLHQQSLEMFRASGHLHGEAASLNSLGIIAASQGRYDQARSYYERSLTRFQALEILPAVGQVLNNLGTVHHTQHEIVAALGYYERSLAIARQIGNRALEADALTGVGLAYANLQQFDRAIAAQQQSIALAEASGDRRLIGLALVNLGDALWQAGELAEAERTLTEALTVLDDLRQELSDRDRISVFDTQWSAYNILQQVLVEAGQPDAALEVAERGRARAFVHLLSARLAQGTPAPDLEVPVPSLADIQHIAREQNATLVQYSVMADARFISQGKLRGDDQAIYIWVISPDGDVAFRQVDLTAIAISLNDLVRGSRHPLGSITNRTADGSRMSQQEHLTILHELLIRPIADVLPADAHERVIFIPQGSLFLAPFPALLDEWGNYLVEEHTIQTAPSIQVLAMTRQQRQQQTTALRQDDMGQAEIAMLASSSVSENLLGNTQADAGVDRQSNPPLVDSSNGSSNGSSNSSTNGSSNDSSNPQPDRSPNVLIVGNPTMPSVSLSLDMAPQPLEPLPAAEEEAIAIADLLNAQALIADAATEEVVTQRMQQAHLIHLATHGLLDYGISTDVTQQDIPGAIALAPSGEPRNSAASRERLSSTSSDGLLTSAEIMDMELRAELAVLSACNTGRGEVTGDGVIGLSRSLIGAGVPSVLVSLWAVPDAPTSDLMVAFYTQLQNTPDKAQALRQAMLITMQTYPDPVDWAAFTLIGEAY